ncbi:hypothetical protein C1646_772832 [Rhizophagus diaphanus]|nr:hypothetical protein C1646_772832 [Rhizophagus diaphanus] [Rhizophagus sp. MUCL 43196]
MAMLTQNVDNKDEDGVLCNNSKLLNLHSLEEQDEFEIPDDFKLFYKFYC